MGYRRRRTSAVSRWIVVAVFLAVGALAGLAAVGWLSSAGEGRAAADSATAADSTARERARVRVEVLNGAGDPGAAEQVARWIRDRGFDVVYFGNASRFDHDVTHVIDRSGETRGARSLARVLSLDSLSADHQPELFLDATVVLGSDWEERFPGATEGRLGGVPGPGPDSAEGPR